MLVLSRRIGQKLIIGEGANKVEVKVLEIGHKRVRLGVMNPERIPVRRGEVVTEKESKDDGTNVG